MSTNIHVLDDDHRNVLDRATRNILNTEAAELAYAQMLDGLPTQDSLWDSFDFVEDHPVETIGHAEICPGFIEKAREHRMRFELGRLNFETKTLQCFQDEPVGSDTFNLRLIELVAIACHQIGAYIYDLDEGAHKNKLYQDWRNKILREKEQDVEERRFYNPPPTAFSHSAYRYPEQYPRGLADVAGYWAESKIFGGVVIFDRGETEEECKAMWIHGDLIKGPMTLYPPTKEQFDSLISFLMSPPDSVTKCPLPIHATKVNRPRWHPYDAFAEYHIFRDRYERKLPPQPPQQGCVRDGVDWPELNDRQVLLLFGHVNDDGKPYVTEEECDAAEERIRNITPSSPLWRSFGDMSLYR
ncbi:hypothetical protein NW768_009908 [Fusarium equiseti]|uniref:Uncharacterized protein n=1 Tax=Fusarium equiseti TaxID=61235 RepID=A0ABQ8R1N8_FUSEQ|nr:hypothetical protein NW768_009908 [Fusarium equiseti]